MGKKSWVFVKQDEEKLDVFNNCKHIQTIFIIVDQAIFLKIIFIFINFAKNEIFHIIFVLPLSNKYLPKFMLCTYLSYKLKTAKVPSSDKTEKLKQHISLNRPLFESTAYCQLERSEKMISLTYMPPDLTFTKLEEQWVV